MSYSVTYRNMPALEPIAIDTCKDLSTALAHACYLLLEGKSNVIVADGSGNQINDDDLVRLLRRDKAA